jgi:hypothetical protein
MTSLNCIPQNVPSLCIPRVFSNITRDRIFRVVDDLGLGRILGIDMVPKISEKGEKYNRIFIHFTAWSTSKDAEKARQIALSGGEFKILYDDPYFWKVSASTCAMPSSLNPSIKSMPSPSLKSNSKLILSSSSSPSSLDHSSHSSSLDHSTSSYPGSYPSSYPGPESRRAKYGPRPDYESKQESRPT